MSDFVFIGLFNTDTRLVFRRLTNSHEVPAESK